MTSPGSGATLTSVTDLELNENENTREDLRVHFASKAESDLQLLGRLDREQIDIH